ncbi:MAG: hypothetical protein Q9182_002817 [Xanthomendoza sp. 2 TL-2023]
MASFDHHQASPYEFARLIPHGLDAERALDKVCSRDDLNAQHRSFIHVERRERDAPDSGTDLSASEGPKDNEDKSYWGGYYSLSLIDTIDKPFSIGWRVGRGSSKLEHDPPRGVDILLIDPGKISHGIAAVHARIQIHPQTGVLMLHAVQEDRPIYYYDTRVPIQINSGDSYVLHRQSNMFRLGNLCYTLVFPGIPDEQYPGFLERRNKMMKYHNLPLPHPDISPVWRQEHTEKGPVILHSSLGSGAFGWVYPAVYRRGGGSAAVKEHKSKDTPEADAIWREIQIGKQFNDQQGLLPIIEAWCEHHTDYICTSLPQNVYTTSPLAISDFKRIPWRPRADIMRTLRLFSGPLWGLVNLHGEGYMHRDVQVGNLFIMSIEPVRGLLGDFGKAIKARTHNDPHLGPPGTLAPEIDERGRYDYDNKIDVWSLAFAIHRVVFPHYYHESYDLMSSSGRVTRQWHQEALACISDAVAIGQLPKGFKHLMYGMLAWDPSKRVSAVEAWNHDLFQAAAQPSPPSTPSSASPSQPPLPHVSMIGPPVSTLQPDAPGQRPTKRLNSTAEHPAPPHQPSLAPQMAASHSAHPHQPTPRQPTLQPQPRLPPLPAAAARPSRPVSLPSTSLSQLLPRPGPSTSRPTPQQHEAQRARRNRDGGSPDERAL